MAYKVLIVEDDPMVAMINGQYVSKNPLFTVAATCRNGQEALDYLENSEEEIDLIVLDVFMPYMDGLETLKKIREQKISAEVIMVTAANDSATIEQTMHSGVIDYLIKPFAYERFQVALEKFVSHKKVLKENAVLDQNSLDKMIASASGQKASASEGSDFGSGRNFGAGGRDETSASVSAALSGGNISGSGTVSNTPQNEALPKGIQKKTLEMIHNYITKNPEWQNVNSISENLHISIVTARHYLSYLEETGFIHSEINYDTGGRPSVLYKKR